MLQMLVVYQARHFPGGLARKHVVCVQERGGTSTFEGTLTKVIFAKLKSSPKLPGEGRVREPGGN